MLYTVFGFESGFLNIADLKIALLKQKHSLMNRPHADRMMRVFSVETEGFHSLEEQFRLQGRFQYFLLLDEVATEVCVSLEVFVGQRVGTIDSDSFGKLQTSVLFSSDVWSPA